MQKGQTLIFLLVGIVILAVVAGGVYYLGTKNKTLSETVSEQNPVIWPSANTEPSSKPSIESLPTNSEETANWKTYHDSEYNVSFRYPPDATLAAKTLYSMLSSEPSEGIALESPYQEPYSKWYEFALVVRENPQNLSAKTIIDNFVRDNLKTCSQPGCFGYMRIRDTLKPYVNGNVDGYIFHVGAETDSAMVVQVKDGKTYSFRMTGDQGVVTDYGLKLFDQILSTFKFTQ